MEVIPSRGGREQVVVFVPSCPVHALPCLVLSPSPALWSLVACADSTAPAGVCASLGTRPCAIAGTPCGGLGTAARCPCVESTALWWAATGQQVLQCHASSLICVCSHAHVNSLPSLPFPLVLAHMTSPSLLAATPGLSAPLSYLCVPRSIGPLGVRVCAWLEWPGLLSTNDVCVGHLPQLGPAQVLVPPRVQRTTVRRAHPGPLAGVCAGVCGCVRVRVRMEVAR